MYADRLFGLGVKQGEDGIGNVTLSLLIGRTERRIGEPEREGIWPHAGGAHAGPDNTRFAEGTEEPALLDLPSYEGGAQMPKFTPVGFRGHTTLSEPLPIQRPPLIQRLHPAGGDGYGVRRIDVHAFV